MKQDKDIVMDKIYKVTALAAFVGLLSNTASAASLDQTITKSLLDHPQVKQAYDNYVTRTHQIDQARGGYFPKLDVVAGIGPEKYDSNQSSTDGKNLTTKEISLSLSQMIFDGFDTSSNVDRTKAEAQAQRYALYALANNTALRVAEVYLNVLRYQEIYQLSKENLATHQAIMADIGKRTESGVGSTADYMQIKGRVARAQANLSSAENNMLDAQAEFFRATNTEPLDLTQPVPDVSKLPATLAEAKTAAQKIHPTLLSADQDIEATRYQYEASKSNFYPKLSIEASKGLYKNSSGIDGYNIDDTKIMLMARYNLFNGGADIAQKRATASQIAEAKDVKQNAARQVSEGLNLAWNARDALLKQKDFTQQHVQASYDTVMAYRKQFLLGTRSLLDVLNTENELFEARQNAVNTDYDELYAEYRILNATGRLLDSVSFKAPSEWPQK
jgi:type I secretion outer membrane protein, TolC family